MPLSKLWPGFAVGFLLLAAACGGGGSTTSPPTAAPTTAPTATPTPAPGTLQLAYTFNGVTVAATAAPPAIAFQAETQTTVVTASQANYSGSYTSAAGAGCGTNVTVTPASSTTGAFTVLAVGPVASGCTITITGAGTSTASVGATVPAPGPLQLNWVANAALGNATAGQTVTPVPGPINLIGQSSLFGAVLVVSKTGYLGTFNAPVLSAPCTGNITPLAAATPTTLGTIAVLGTVQTYYSVVAPTTGAPIATSGGCTITVTDNAVNPLPANGTATIGISVTTTGGGIQ